MEASNNQSSYPPSPFMGHATIEYFQFEEDFVEEGVRCIPMVVRFKMDAAGIKLSLSEWSQFAISERLQLALLPCDTNNTIVGYHQYLADLIKKHTHRSPTPLPESICPWWNNTNEIPAILREKAGTFGWEITIGQWQKLTVLQRYALLKLCRTGHENSNFPLAMKEFGLLVNSTPSGHFIKTTVRPVNHYEYSSSR
jgi:hypothetical protein